MEILICILTTIIGAVAGAIASYLYVMHKIKQAAQQANQAPH